MLCYTATISDRNQHNWHTFIQAHRQVHKQQKQPTKQCNFYSSWMEMKSIIDNIKGIPIFSIFRLFSLVHWTSRMQCAMPPHVTVCANEWFIIRPQKTEGWIGRLVTHEYCGLVSYLKWHPISVTVWISKHELTKWILRKSKTFKIHLIFFIRQTVCRSDEV